MMNSRTENDFAYLKLLYNLNYSKFWEGKGSILAAIVEKKFFLIYICTSKQNVYEKNY